MHRECIDIVLKKFKEEMGLELEIEEGFSFSRDGKKVDAFFAIPSKKKNGQLGSCRAKAIPVSLSGLFFRHRSVPVPRPLSYIPRICVCNNHPASSSSFLCYYANCWFY